MTLSWDIQDWRELGQDRQEAQLRDTEAERVSGFDPARAPLMRFALVKRQSTSGGSSGFVITFCSMAGAGRSSSVMPLTPTPRSAGLKYWRRRHGAPIGTTSRGWQDADQNAARRFWTARLAGFHEPTPIVAALPAIEVSGGEPLFALRTRLILASRNSPAERHVAPASADVEHRDAWRVGSAPRRLHQT